jgi:hypothetical protein
MRRRRTRRVGSRCPPAATDAALGLHPRGNCGASSNYSPPRCERKRSNNNSQRPMNDEDALRLNSSRAKQCCSILAAAVSPFRSSSKRIDGFVTINDENLISLVLLHFCPQFVLNVHVPLCSLNYHLVIFEDYKTCTTIFLELHIDRQVVGAAELAHRIGRASSGVLSVKTTRQRAGKKLHTLVSVVVHAWSQSSTLPST